MSRKTRRELLRTVAEHVRRTGDPTVPWDRMPELASEFRDVADVLSTMHRRWYARFAALLDGLLEDPPANLSRAVGELWVELAAGDPHTRAVLDAYRGHPVVARADERQRQLLAQATGGELNELPPATREPALAN